MDEEPLVVYHGPDAEDIAERWGREPRPFDLRGVVAGDDVVALVRAGTVDSVVIDGGEDLRADSSRPCRRPCRPCR